jgi:hypothetical protein
MPAGDGLADGPLARLRFVCASAPTGERHRMRFLRTWAVKATKTHIRLS